MSDMRVSKLSAKVFLKVNYSFKVDLSSTVTQYLSYFLGG